MDSYGRAYHILDIRNTVEIRRHAIGGRSDGNVVGHLPAELEEYLKEDARRLECACRGADVFIP